MTASTAPFFRASGHAGFRDDKYYRYTRTSVTVMAGWPRLLAWQRSARQPAWRMVRPDISRPSLEDPVTCTGACAISLDGERSPHCQRHEGDCLLAHDAWLHWCALIPRGVREAVQPFSERHWHLLSLAARCGQPAIDLLHSNPALAWALASSWVFRAKPVRDPMRSARRLLAPGKSQRDILAWLDFPATEAARRQLRKLPPGQASVNNLLALRDAMRNPDAMKRLAHLPRLNHGIVRLLSDPELRPFASHALLMEIATRGHRPLHDDSPDRSEEKYARSAMTMRDCLRMMDVLGIPGTRLGNLRSRTELTNIHDRLVRRLRGAWNDGELVDRAPLTLPPPPFPGTAGIEPLTTEFDLFQEGDTMNHCVGSYGQLVASGAVAVYRITFPERATLAIEQQSGTWRISELKLANNKEPAPATRMAIASWLGKVQSLRWQDP